MIEEVLRDITAAEAQAEAMQQDAFQTGKDIVLNAEIEAERQKKATINECRGDMRRAVQSAEALAEANRAKVLELGKVDAAQLAKRKEKDVDVISDRILKEILDKYC